MPYGFQQSLRGRYLRLCLHYLWLVAFLLVFLVMTSCQGTSSTPQEAHSWLWTDQSRLAVLSWHLSARGAATLTGQWKLLTSQPHGQVAIEIQPITGKEEPQGKVVIELSGRKLAGRLLNGMQLFLFPLSANKAASSSLLIWHMISSSMVETVTSAFQTSVQLTQALQYLEQLLEHVPADSDPNSLQFQVVAVQEDIQALWQIWNTTILMQKTQQQRCQALPLLLSRLPLRDSFQVEALTERTVTKAWQSVQRDWQSLSKKHLAHSPMLLPWLPSFALIQQRIRPATQLLQALRQAVIAATSQLREAKQSYQQLLEGVEKAQHVCLEKGGAV